MASSRVRTQDRSTSQAGVGQVLTDEDRVALVVLDEQQTDRCGFVTVPRRMSSGAVRASLNGPLLPTVHLPLLDRTPES